MSVATRPTFAIVWRHPGADADLAAALGGLAADLWLAGKVTLTCGPGVPTLGPAHAPVIGGEVTNDQAADLRC